MHNFFTQRLSSHTNCTVIPAGDLIAGKRNAENSEIIYAYSSWGAVHGSGSSYTRMALYMIDNLFRTSFREPAAPPKANSGKRPRSESASSSGGSSSHSNRQNPSRNPAVPRYREDRKEERTGGEYSASAVSLAAASAAASAAVFATATAAAPSGALAVVTTPNTTSQVLGANPYL